jgi:hypothetical protein
VGLDKRVNNTSAASALEYPNGSGSSFGRAVFPRLKSQLFGALLILSKFLDYYWIQIFEQAKKYKNDTKVRL